MLIMFGKIMEMKHLKSQENETRLAQRYCKPYQIFVLCKCK